MGGGLGHVPLRPPFGPALKISRNAAQSAASKIIDMTKYDNSGIMQTCPCNVNPLKPHFYIIKLEFTRELFFLFFALKLDCGSCFVIAWKDNKEKSCFTLNNYFNMQVINTEIGIRVIHVAAVPG